MTVIAYKIGRRTLWGFNILVQPWPHDGKNDVILGSVAMPESVPRVLPAEVEEQLLLLSKKIERLQRKSQRIVERAYSQAPLWKDQREQGKVETLTYKEAEKIHRKLRW